MLSLETLKEQIQGMENQRIAAHNMMHQCAGAVSVLQKLLSQLMEAEKAKAEAEAERLKEQSENGEANQ